MKLFIVLFFLLLSVAANSQMNAQNKPLQSEGDSLVVPSLTREWTAVDFEEVFKNIIQKQMDTSAARITMANYKGLFSKITDPKSYWFLNSKYHTLNERFSFNLSLQEKIKSIFLNYYRENKILTGLLKNEKEVAAFYCLMFFMTKNQMQLADEFVKANPNLTQIQLDGIKKMTYGVNSMLGGGLLTIEKEYFQFSEASICKISNAVNDFYFFMYSRIDEESKAEFDRRIAGIIKGHKFSCVKAAFQK
jgi:hypothetical protein